jgi:hypothetical protein
VQMDGTCSYLCPVAGFVIKDVQNQLRGTRVLVIYDPDEQNNRFTGLLLCSNH